MHVSKGRLALLALVSLALCGCDEWPSQNSTITTQTTQTGYACSVKSPQSKAIFAGWSVDLSVAKEKALRMCRLSVAYPRHCHIRACDWMKRPLIANGWYTCYVKSRGRYDVWSATSHNAAQAKAKAMSRCQQFSDHTRSCEFSYCWLWAD